MVCGAPILIHQKEKPPILTKSMNQAYIKPRLHDAGAKGCLRFSFSLAVTVLKLCRHREKGVLVYSMSSLITNRSVEGKNVHFELKTLYLHDF